MFALFLASSRGNRGNPINRSIASVLAAYSRRRSLTDCLDCQIVRFGLSLEYTPYPVLGTSFSTVYLRRLEYVCTSPPPSFLLSSPSIIPSFHPSINHPSSIYPSILQPQNIQIFDIQILKNIQHSELQSRALLSLLVRPSIHHQPPIHLITLLVTTRVLTYIPRIQYFLR